MERQWRPGHRQRHHRADRYKDAAPGNYTVTAHVTDAKMKNNGEASCSATYTIKPLPPKNPPTMSCTASPSSVQAGSSVTVSCICTSPDGVPVTSRVGPPAAARLSGNGSTATLTPTAHPGPITVARPVLTLAALPLRLRLRRPWKIRRRRRPRPAKLSQCDFSKMEDWEAVARGQHLQGDPGRRCQEPAAES